MTGPQRIIAHSVVVDASAEVIYDMLADVTRMGEWSSACVGATWDEDSGPLAVQGAWFTGHNVMGAHAYDARCQITDAMRPTTIAWMQGGAAEGIAEWRYRLDVLEGGTRITESWTLVRPFPRSRVDAEMEQALRGAFDRGIRETLDRLKEQAERP